eukprot:1394616-Rhodomonas_salina.1
MPLANILFTVIRFFCVRWCSASSLYAAAMSGVALHVRSSPAAWARTQGWDIWGACGKKTKEGMVDW